MRMLVVLCILGCASSPSHSPEPIAPAPAPRPAAAEVVAPAEPVRAPDGSPYGAEVRSVRFLSPTVLRKQPAMTADKLGIIAKHARARAVRAAPAGQGCRARWIEIAPRGWACETAVEPSPDEPTPARHVAFDGEEDADRPVVPGVYGVVRGRDVPVFASRADVLAGKVARTVTSATSVRARGMVQVDGRRYWITSDHELIAAASIARFSPSTFRGVALDDTTALPLAWTRAHGRPRAPVVVREAPSLRGAIAGTLAPRTVVSIVERSADGRFVRAADAGWIARADLRVAELAAPPPGTAGDERWFDIDLDEQVLVAYEGERPVYATLVSTGKLRFRTPPGIARVASKHERADMVSEKREAYSVSDVPWTMYYDHDYALHTSYWHDGFGAPRSHGCINLAPHDARLLYAWSSPDVPPGWTTVYGDEDTPGSLVRVRSHHHPEPAFRGYARAMRERATRTADRELAAR